MRALAHVSFCPHIHPYISVLQLDLAKRRLMERIFRTADWELRLQSL
jgi:hypothetical protein